MKKKIARFALFLWLPVVMAHGPCPETDGVSPGKLQEIWNADPPKTCQECLDFCAKNAPTWLGCAGYACKVYCPTAAS